MYFHSKTHQRLSPSPLNLLSQNSLTRELTVRVVGLPPPPPPKSPFPQIFLSDLVWAPTSLHQPLRDKGHTVIIIVIIIGFLINVQV